MKKIIEFWSYTDTIVVYVKLVVDPLHFMGLLFLVLYILYLLSNVVTRLEKLSALNFKEL